MVASGPTVASVVSIAYKRIWVCLGRLRLGCVPCLVSLEAHLRLLVREEIRAARSDSCAIVSALSRMDHWNVGYFVVLAVGSERRSNRR
jgi:hypothetical protein